MNKLCTSFFHDIEITSQFRILLNKAIFLGRIAYHCAAVNIAYLAQFMENTFSTIKSHFSHGRFARSSVSCICTHRRTVEHRWRNHRDRRIYRNNRMQWIVKLMQTYNGELFALCIFSLGLTDAVSRFKAPPLIVFIDRMLIYARFAIIAGDYCIKFSRTVDSDSIIQPFHSRLFAIARLTFMRACCV